MEIIDKCWARIQLFSLHYLPFFCLRLPSRRSKINQLKHSFINIFLSTLSLPLLFIGINKPKFTRLVLSFPKYIQNIDSLFPAHPCIINVPNKTVRSLLDHHRNFFYLFLDGIQLNIVTTVRQHKQSESHYHSMDLHKSICLISTLYTVISVILSGPAPLCSAPFKGNPLIFASKRYPRDS